jgi:hypothetical protein
MRFLCCLCERPYYVLARDHSHQFALGADDREAPSPDVQHNSRTRVNGVAGSTYATASVIIPATGRFIRSS